MCKEKLTLFDAMLSPLCDLVSNSIAVASKPQIVDIDSDEELEKKVVRKID